MKQNNRIHERFEYHLEDCDCQFCQHNKGKKRGCARAACCCEDEKRDAIAHGRIKRKRGWFRCRE